MKALSSFITKFDIIGQEYSFEQNDNKRHQTLSGAIFTSIIIITSLVLGFIFGQELYLKEKPSVSVSEEYSSLSKIYFKEYPLLFQFFINSVITDNYVDYFDVEILSVTLDNNYNISSVAKKPLVNCMLKQKEFTSNQYFISALLNVYPYFCFDFDENDYFQNKMLTQNSTYSTISISFCDITDETRNCKATQEFKEYNNYLILAFVDNYVDSYDYKNPVKQYTNTINYGLNYNVVKTIRLSFQKITFASNNGWLLDNNIYYDNIVYSGLDIDTGISLGINKNLLMNVVIQGNNIRKKTSRSYLKVQELFAKIGGVANVLYIVIYTISYHYIRFQYIIWVRENSIELIHDSLFSKDYRKINSNSNKKNNTNNEIKSNIGKTNINEIKFINTNKDSNIKDKTINLKPQMSNENIISFNNNNNENKEITDMNQINEINNSVASKSEKNMFSIESNADIVRHKSNNLISNQLKILNLNIPTNNINFDNFELQFKNKKRESNINIHSNSNNNNNEKQEQSNNKEKISYFHSKENNMSFNFNKKEIKNKIDEINHSFSHFNKKDSKHFDVDQSILKSYYNYLIYYVNCCYSNKEMNLLFKKEINKVNYFLSIKNFNFFLINQYNKMFVCN